MTNAVYPGTFDPVHSGHVDIATRAAGLFDHLTVAIYDRPLKNLLFNTAERKEMIEVALGHIPNISVVTYNQLTVDFARQVGARVVVRGLRVISDFELEFQMALTNKKLAPDIEFVCLMTRQTQAFLSSSIVKEIALLKGDISKMVPSQVADALEAKRLEREKNHEPVPVVSLRD